MDKLNNTPLSDSYIKMDYTLESPQDRIEKVKEIIAATPSEKLNNNYLEKLADYVIFAQDKQERKEKKILTDNRMFTVNKRETSYEGLVGKLENGEDGIYNMIANDKNIIFQPKVTITDADVAEIPELKKLREAIKSIEEQLKTAHGKRAYALRKQLIEMRQDQYVIKNCFRRPIYCMNLIRNFPKIDLSEEIFIDEETGAVKSTGLINFFDEKHVSAILCNYSRLVEDNWENFSSDAKWMMMDFDAVCERALAASPLYSSLVLYKIDGKSNAEIQKLLEEEHGIKHSVEYISSLWRNKIPKLIVEQATKDWLEWHYTIEERGVWKKCSRCGQIKLAHNLFFSKNKTSKDGYYSICKTCRNKKKGE